MEHAQRQKSRSLTDDLPASAGGDSTAKAQLKSELAAAGAGEQEARLRPARPFGIAPKAVQGPVQTDSGSNGVDASRVKEAAASGLSGSSTQLPHFDKIQKSFGDHDVGSVSAHVGGPAAKATSAMGATAYATGNSVAFKSSPDLHTAAHEAAHVIQQRAGVSLPGGVGRVGDSYEKNADAVADRVVSGRSAAELLPGGGGPTAGVQRAVQRAGDTSGEGALPEESYEEIGGVEHRLYIKVEGSTATVMQNPAPKPVKEVSDSKNPFSIALQVEQMTRDYIAMPKGSAKEAKLKEIKAKMRELAMAMKVARGDLLWDTKLRRGFEKVLGEKAFEGSEGTFKLGKTSVDQAFLEMVNMIGLAYAPRAKAATDMKEAFKKFEKVKETEKFKATIESLGIDKMKGYAGAVGEEYDAIKGALSPSADMNQKIVHLHSFTETDFFDKEVTNKQGKAYERMQANMGPEWRKAMDDQIDKETKGKKKAEFKEMGVPDPTTGEIIKGFKSAKDVDMDRKRPYQPIENLNIDSLTFLCRKHGVPKDKVDGALAESSAAKRKQKLVDILKKDYEVTISGTPKTWTPGREAAGGDAQSFVGSDENTGFNKGILDNLLDANNAWVQNARALRMPLTSGISGTTRRVCGVSVILGVKEVENIRLAMLGQCIKIDMHSFHEVMAAAEGYPNCAYSAGSYIPFAPIKPTDMWKLGVDYLKTDPKMAGKVTGQKDLDKQAEYLLNAPKP